MVSTIRVGIIGGSGFDRSDILSNRIEHEIVDTPYGRPSDNLVSGIINGVQCVLCFRHGRQHSFNPTNYRANLWALKQLGVNLVLATTAVGSLSQDFPRGTLVIFGIEFVLFFCVINFHQSFDYNLDNFIDMTKHRPNTFYDHELGHLQGLSIDHRVS
ncbi:unnamed protein product [Rotaria sp. Silwood2]|nr:unnamed protein product [Rotaria sp. Silwood2]CAF4558534.1 unnamed protein product [Rotaria sp. Silwood2]